MRHPSVAMAVAFLVAAFLAPATQAAERKAGDARKSGSAAKSTGLLIDDEARHAGATAFSTANEKCGRDDDGKGNGKDNARGGMRALDRSRHPRPDECDDDDDGDDCDHHGDHKDKHKDKCKSPKK
jgi:hypothetical protein